MCVLPDPGDLLLVLCLTMAACVLSASFAVFLVRERECASKALQLVAGAPPSAFWAATYAWELLTFCVPALGGRLLPHQHNSHFYAPRLLIAVCPDVPCLPPQANACRFCSY